MLNSRHWSKLFGKHIQTPRCEREPEPVGHWWAEEFDQPDFFEIADTALGQFIHQVGVGLLVSLGDLQQPINVSNDKRINR